MTYLNRLRQEDISEAPTREATKPTEAPSVGSVATLPGPPKNIEPAFPLRDRALAKLAQDPTLLRAMAADESDPAVVRIGYAIRGQAACEITVPRSKYDGIKFLEAFERAAAAPLPQITPTDPRPTETEIPIQPNPGDPPMSLTVTETAGSFELAPAGAHRAVCFKLIDIGTQRTEYLGQPRSNRKILVGWELPDEPMADGKPFACFKRYTASLSEKAALRADLEAWRGRPFTAEELAGFDLKKIISTPCLLNVVHTEKGGRTFADVGSLMPLPKGTPRPAPINPPVFFDLDAPDMQVFAALGEKLQAQILASPEGQKLKAAPAAPAPAGNGFASMEDDVPW